MQSRIVQSVAKLEPLVVVFTGGTFSEIPVGPGRFPGIAGNAGNHGNDGKFQESHKIFNQI